MSKAKRKRPVVRGPQKSLPFAGRTPRLRFVEPPQKKHGRPFFAFRAEGGLLAAFKRHAKSVKAEPAELVRAFMAKVSGWEAEVAE